MICHISHYSNGFVLVNDIIDLDNENFVICFRFLENIIIYL